MYSFIVYKYLNLILWEKIHFKENQLIFFRVLGEVELILRIWGAKEKYCQGAEEFSFMDLGRSVHYFQGSREHIPPGGSSYEGCIGFYGYRKFAVLLLQSILLPLILDTMFNILVTFMDIEYLGKLIMEIFASLYRILACLLLGIWDIW